MNIAGVEVRTSRMLPYSTVRELRSPDLRNPYPRFALRAYHVKRVDCVMMNEGGRQVLAVSSEGATRLASLATAAAVARLVELTR